MLTFRVSNHALGSLDTSTRARAREKRTISLQDQGQALRDEIHAVMLNHSALDRPLTAKSIQPRLGRVPPPALRTIQWHMREIRAAHAKQSLRLAQFQGDTA